MKTHQYILIESIYTVNGTRYTTYGIAQTDVSDGCAVILKAIPDLSTDKDRVIRLAELCTKLCLAPIHISDIVEDFLGE
ncbi:MAG: hypothetical protein IJ325_13335 [Clostridia bacterium]|nr:hypothetical protein [Clostridia bacterium]